VTSRSTGRAVVGAASPAGTRAWAERRSAAGGAAYGLLGRTGLTVCRLGFGGYRVNDETPVHRSALERAIAGGVNLVDTSTNYTDGSSERLVGRVVGDAIRKGRIAREEIVLVSKIGYVQGENLALAQERETAGRPFPDMVHYQSGCWHCVHPEFLEDQLARSLGRLDVETLDVCLLHNPEYFLSDAAHSGGAKLETVRGEFYRRLTAAFRFFEERVSAGRLGWYGVSSNTVANPVDDPEATSLARMLAAAEEAGGPGHRFGVLQLPMNLFEAGGALERNNPPGAPASARRTVLELASAEGIGVLVNRPLNAVVGRGMVRLADFAVEPAGALDRQLESVRKLEAEYRKEIAAKLRVGPDSDKPESFFRWGDQLDAVKDRVASVTYWEQVEWQVRGLTARVVGALDAGIAGALAGQWRGWRDRYRPELDRLLDGFRAVAAGRSQVQSRAIAAAVDPLLPPERRGAGLAQKSLWTLASTPGVSAVLVGMRRPAYVEDATGMLGWPPLADPPSVYEAVRALRLPAA
jgi:aryl-alcohol dehydrogenase-like predicted oxidoreductase